MDHQHADLIALRLFLWTLLATLMKAHRAEIAATVEVVRNLPEREWHDVPPAHRESVQLALEELLGPISDAIKRF